MPRNRVRVTPTCWQCNPGLVPIHTRGTPLPLCSDECLNAWRTIALLNELDTCVTCGTTGQFRLVVFKCAVCEDWVCNGCLVGGCAETGLSAECPRCA